jgi:glycerol-3-phosphate acyltransferase PlsX
MGGDHAPDEIVAGALAAQREHGVRVLLTGPRAR